MQNLWHVQSTMYKKHIKLKIKPKIELLERYLDDSTKSKFNSELLKYLFMKYPFNCYLIDKIKSNDILKYENNNTIYFNLNYNNYKLLDDYQYNNFKKFVNSFIKKLPDHKNTNYYNELFYIFNKLLMHIR